MLHLGAHDLQAPCVGWATRRFDQGLWPDLEPGMSTPPFHVLLVEDDPDFRTLVATLLDGAGRYAVAAADPARWFDDVREAQPDIALLDLTLQEVDVLPSMPRLVAACPRTMIAVLTVRPAEEAESVTLDAGAFVFYEKTAMEGLPDYLERDLERFRHALDGEEVIAPSAFSRRASTTAAEQPAEPR